MVSGMKGAAHQGLPIYLLINWENKVAFDRTRPGGRVLGIDILPAQPPRGVSTIQGNFLSESVREKVRNLLADPDQGRHQDEKLLRASSYEEAMATGDLDSPADQVKTTEEAAICGDSTLTAAGQYRGTVDVVSCLHMRSTSDLTSSHLGTQ